MTDDFKKARDEAAEAWLTKTTIWRVGEHGFEVAFRDGADFGYARGQADSEHRLFFGEGGIKELRGEIERLQRDMQGEATSIGLTYRDELERGYQSELLRLREEIDSWRMRALNAEGANDALTAILKEAQKYFPGRLELTDERDRWREQAEKLKAAMLAECDIAQCVPEGIGKALRAFEAFKEGEK